MSDFSRAFQPNSNPGSDNGWGGHHIVVGEAVRGAKLRRERPLDSFYSSVQYAATLASWFGVSASQLGAIFPGLGGFNSTNLGFV
jgi:uncharacterized protein (DUF1501 family)